MVTGDVVVEGLKEVYPLTTTQSVTPSEGYDAMAEVVVQPVTAQIDANIIPGNIKKDVSILGVVGTLEATGAVETVHCMIQVAGANPNTTVTVSLGNNWNSTRTRKFSPGDNFAYHGASVLEMVQQLFNDPTIQTSGSSLQMQSLRFATSRPGSSLDSTLSAAYWEYKISDPNASTLTCYEGNASSSQNMEIYMHGVSQSGTTPYLVVDIKWSDDD